MKSALYLTRCEIVTHLGLSSDGRGHVEIIVTNNLSRLLPSEFDKSPRSRGQSVVRADSGSSAESVGLVGNVQSGEVLPLDTRVGLQREAET